MSRREKKLKRLENLTKEDLIKVIAVMHEAVWGEWYDRNIREESVDIISSIGDACGVVMVEDLDWDLSDLKNKIEV